MEFNVTTGQSFEERLTVLDALGHVTYDGIEP